MLALLLRAHEEALGVAVRMSDHRVAQVGDPWDARRALHRRADELDRRRRRRREHDVDLLVLDDADRRRDRRQVPAHVLVGHEQPSPRELQLLPRSLEAGRAVQLLRGLAALRAEIARAVHPREHRRKRLVVTMDPLRVVGREHMRLDPELGQVGRELERALHAATARRREVHRDEQDLHRGAR